ncbi:MAG: cytochrome b [Alphaproteobacteria bacterium]|nr:cytochrome b [Alphaproteobacteria bacterium]
MRDDIQLRYGTVAMIFHWLIAALLIANLALGLYFADLPRGDWRTELGQLHKSIGLTVLMLSVLRLAWRLTHPVPPLPAGMRWGLRFAARATHWLFYVLIIGIPLTGWIFVSASPVPTIFFGLFHWPNLWFMADMPRAQKIPLRETFNSIHVVLAWAAIVLIPLHVLAALYHQYIRRDELLPRMLPYRRTRVETMP